MKGPIRIPAQTTNNTPLAFSVCWAFTTSLSVLLALERCLEQARPRLARWLFSRGPRLWCWMVPVLLYSVFYGFFTVPLTFSSITWNWEFNPHMGYLPDPDNLVHLYSIPVHCTLQFVQYDNHLDSVHTFAVAITLPSLYLLYAILFSLKWTQMAQLTEMDSRIMRKVNYLPNIPKRFLSTKYT